MSNDALPALVKWSGSKRSVAGAIAAMLPPDGRYFEPFVGGGAVMGTQPARVIIAGDSVPELVALWELVRSDPEAVTTGYAERWQRLDREGHTAYYEIRARFNATRDPHDLLFLTRTCVNGLVRFNRDGMFNNSLHHTRKGVAPERFARVVERWHGALAHARFVCGDFAATLSDARASDVAFLDPPYVGTRGRYHPVPFDFNQLWDALRDLNERDVRWVLTLDGTAGAREYGTDWVPSDVFSSRGRLATGSSPFARVMQGRVDTVSESVFANFDVEAVVVEGELVA